MDKKVEILIRSESGILPSYETAGAAGMDISAFLEEPVVLQPGKRALIPTGLYLQIPEGYEVQIRARSGLALRHGIALVNGVGTVDSDYRGEIGVLLINLGEEPFTIQNGDRIAQMVVSRFVSVKWRQAARLQETERGGGGFGHTGK